MEEGGADQGGDIFRQVQNPGGMAQRGQDEAPGFQIPEVGDQADQSGGGDVLRRIPTPMNPVDSRSGEGPREGATLKRPSSPTSMAGSSFQAGPAQTGLMPFQPLGSPDVSSMVHPHGSVFGSQGGLQEGGFGMGLDPTPNQASDPISTLLQFLMKQGG